jgi:acetylornithine aminotransferase
VTPDLITTAKALGGGLPVGACVIAPALGDGLGPGEHGSTFAGGPIGAAAALEALALLSDAGLLAAVERNGELLERRLLAIEGVDVVRRRGLMLGVGLEAGLDSRLIVGEALARGLVANAPEPATIRLLPALTIAERELERGVGLLAEAISAVRLGAE